MTGLSAVMPVLAGGAINSFVLGLFIAVLAQLLLWLIARRQAATRFALLYSALLGILAAFLWQARPSPTDSVTAATFSFPSRWATYLVCAWATVALLGLLRIGFGLGRLRQLRQSFVPFENEELLEIVRAGTKRRTSLFVSDQVRVPTAIGFFRPAVVLPEWTLSSLSREELKAAVLHELAHVERWDDWTNLGQKIMRALLFFHPAVWWLDARLSIEREISCDDAVLAQSTDPHRYAECLVSMAEKTFLRRQLALAQAAVGHVKQTALRIAKILDGQKRESRSAWKPALAALAAFSILAPLATEHTPQLVGFSDTQPLAPAVVADVAAQPSHAQVVPASLKDELAPSKPALSSRKPKTPKATISKPAPKREIENYVARENNQLLGGARAVPASTTQQVRQPQFMFVVFQTREYDASGNVTVTTTVWRMQVRTSTTASVEGLVPHST